MNGNIAGLFGLSLFVVIAFSYESAFWEAIDEWAAKMLEGNTLLSAFHVIGNTDMIIGLTLLCSVYMVLHKKAWLPALFSIFVVASGHSLNQLLKSIFTRPRPDVAGQLTSYSFPSGHSMVTTICLFTLIFVLQQQFFKLKRLYFIYAGAFTIVVLVALSRVAETRHYFTDVIAGISLGVACVVAAAYVYKKIIH